MPRSQLAAVQTSTLLALLCLIGGCCEESAPLSEHSNPTLVKPDGSGTHATIQDAINAAEDGDVIELDDGVFRGDGNRDISFNGKSLTIRSRNGNPYACMIDCQGDSLNHHRGFSFDHGEDLSARIEGLGITNGYVAFQGGCIRFSNHSSATLANLLLTESRAQEGAAISCWLGSNPVIEDCAITANRSGLNGALACFESSPTVIRCRFWDNTAPFGGGISLWRESDEPALVEECTIELNQAINGGALFLQEVTTEVRNCLFRNNTGWGGGAVFCHEASPMISGCTSHHNYAEYGGMLHCQVRCSPAIARCTVCYEIGTNAGAAIHLIQDSSVDCEQCIFAYYGGDAAVDISDDTCFAILRCCNVCGNTGGDWVGPIQGQLGVDGNIREWPRFCNRELGDYNLHPQSPCI